MKHAFLPAASSLLVVIALAACDRQSPAPGSTASPAPPATLVSPPSSVQPPAKPAPRRITPEEIAQIEASGKTGLWSDTMEACRGAKPVRMTLTWNVKPSGAERVVIYVVDRKGVERNFGQGGPVGFKQTGAWAGAGTEFKVRAAGTKDELATLVIGEKNCAG